MQKRLTRLVLLVSLALAGAACAAPPTTTLVEGPSQFLAGFRVDSVVASMNATSSEPRCPTTSTERSHTAGAGGGRSEAVLTTACDDQGDGTSLAQAWAAGISAELDRLGSVVTMTSTVESTSGATFTNAWEYVSNGSRGQITLEVQAGPHGHYSMIVHILEPPG